MDYNSLPNFYAALDAKYNVTNNELNSATYTNVDCNFVYSAKYARHRWFNYKEGFSPILVEKIFNEYKLNKSSVVCDPFCGAGTTVAVAKAKGMKSIALPTAFITLKHLYSTVGKTAMGGDRNHGAAMARRNR